MGSLEHNFANEDLHPIDLVENLAQHHSWDFDRVNDDQIAMFVDGTWKNYSLSLAWSGTDETLRMICTFDINPPKSKLPELYDLLNRANDRTWSGAFSLWQEQQMMVYRYGLNLAGGATASVVQIDDMVGNAVAVCERFYPAFQLVCWGDSTALAAMDVAMEQAYGRA